MAKERAFDWSSFAFSLRGTETQGCKDTPSGRFLPTATDGKNPGIAFSGWYNHEMMDKPGYYQALSFDQFRYLLNVIRRMNALQSEQPIIEQIALRYYKDGEWKQTGTSVGICREPSGEIFFAFKNKKIPTVRFYLRMDGAMEHQNKDREPVEVNLSSQLAVETIVGRWEYMLNTAIKQAMDDQAMGGGNRSNSNGRSGGGNGGGSSSQAPAGGSDFDDDIPF